jgi:hypothetical protein
LPSWDQSKVPDQLALEVGDLRIFGNFIGYELQRDKAMQPDVLGFVNHTHTAAAQLFNGAVVRDSLADTRPGIDQLAASK